MDEGQQLDRVLMDWKLTTCVNFIPITCRCKWGGEVTTKPEIATLLKTYEEHFEEVAATVKELVSYTDFVRQIEVKNANDALGAWLDQVVETQR